ncbi:GNAT family N-acetyltransferase [Paenibacillus humicola]|uniref:GNAT family N-acetyltransferase n=1 Tax=Paenibacillus humicola TaxID=3110540 RepID=UPI00237BB8C5|nr:GNAT family N-acetyltransferase [Paenibacillus humicola]
MILYQQDKLSVRVLQKDDAELLVRWLSDPKVLEYYEGRDNAHDLDKVREHFYREDEATRCIVQYEEIDIGYIQFYPVLEEERRLYGYTDRQETLYGMDQFIGETQFWNTGIGTKLVASMRDYLMRRGVDAIVMDPQAWNHRALRCYEKCGFVKMKMLPSHERHEGEMRDCWLIEYRK